MAQFPRFGAIHTFFPFFFFLLCARSGAVTGLAVKNLGHRQQTETPSVAVMLSRNQ